jgi:dipeptidyl-peptidase-4
MKYIFTFVITISSILYSQNKLFTLEDIFKSQKFKSKSLNGVCWLEQGEKFSYQQQDSSTKSNNIYIYNSKDGSRNLLVNVSELKLDPSDPIFEYSSYQWSPREQDILFVSEPPEKQYMSRLTPAGNYFLYRIKDRSFRRLTNVNEPQYNQKFSPDGKMLGYVRGNNLYIIDLASGVETQLTNDGSLHIINGKFDWVYEEEFSISDGWRWSPDGKSIAYWRLDESQIPEFNMIDYMTSHCDAITMRYPKAGDSNSLVKIGVISLKTKSTIWMDLGPEKDIYIPRIFWTPDGNSLIIYRLNRRQNKMELLLGNIQSGETRIILSEEEQTWISEDYDIRFIPSKGQMLRISEKDGYAHIYRHDLNGKLINQVTKGKWDVDNIVGVDDSKGLIFFTARMKTLLEKQMYSVTFDGNTIQQVTQDNYNHSVNLSSNNRFFLDYYSDANTPAKIEFGDIEKKYERKLEDNNIPALKYYTFSPVEFFTFTTSDTVILHASMIKPTNFNSKKKYPVLFDVYGGPGSQTVTNSWGGQTHLWYQLLAQKGYIVVSVDGRGTGGRGKAFKEIVYRQLGKWEVNDQTEAVKYLSTLTYIDTSRIGIWGWSYGGYIAVSAILRGADYFKSAIAVAPVTDWSLYDNVYTERYMGLPNENPAGYKESSALTYVEKLKGNLLIIHGTTDDNVHWQNSIQLVNALEKAGKQFRTMFYPNKNHGIGGGNTRYHLFEMMTNYILEKL